jgi:hypothetical protein
MPLLSANSEQPPVARRAREIVAALGLDAAVARSVSDAPALTDAQRAELRRVFRPVHRGSS